jgi:alkylhydroperoxidase family enzyme
MKLKLIVLLLMVAAITLGFFLGRFQANYSRTNELQRLEKLAETEQGARAAAEYLKQLMRPEADRARDGFNQAFGPLAALRRGDTNGAIQDLEDHAEMHIDVVSAFLLDLPVGERDPRHLARVKAWRDYCAAHPRQSVVSEEMASRFASLLSTNR